MEIGTCAIGNWNHSIKDRNLADLFFLLVPPPLFSCGAAADMEVRKKAKKSKMIFKNLRFLEIDSALLWAGFDWLLYN